MSSIFEESLSTSQALEAFGDRNVVAAMLRFEAALARAQATVGLIPDAAAQSIIGTCKVDLFDVAKIVRLSGRSGSPAMALVDSLKETVGLFNKEAVAYVHFGSTGQDVIDTAMALITREALELIDADVEKTVAALLALAERHAAAPMLARTLMQPASITSFGLKCVVWAAPLVRSRGRLRAASSHALCVQLGGAVGTLAHMGDKGTEVTRLMADELELGAATAPWHTQRDEWVALGCELGLLVGSLGKIAKDISLMGQFEVGEVGEVAEPSEHGRGGSSAMPHKRNPVACMVALAAAQRAPHRVAALLASMPQEHERGLGAWQAELAEWAQLLMSTHGSARALALALPGLQVDTTRMRGHIDTLRLQIPKDVADQWLDPRLVRHAAQLTRTQLTLLRREPSAPSARAMS